MLLESSRIEFRGCCCLNEFLFEPVLPAFTVDKKERYPNNKVLEQDLFGLKRRFISLNNGLVISSCDAVGACSELRPAAAFRIGQSGLLARVRTAGKRRSFQLMNSHRVTR